jgi:hypothetical protein
MVWQLVHDSRLTGSPIYKGDPRVVDGPNTRHLLPLIPSEAFDKASSSEAPWLTEMRWMSRARHHQYAFSKQRSSREASALPDGYRVLG